MIRDIDPVRAVLNAAFAVLIVAYFSPLFVNSDVEVAGWPLFALWVVVVGPLLVVVVFGVNSYYRIKRNDALGGDADGV